MPGLRNWRHLQREGLKRQPQQHNATTDNNSQQRNHDAMTNEKARSSTRACLLPNNGTTRQARHLHLAGIRATQLAILAITSFSAALPPEVTRQRTKPSKHRHLRIGQCASREPITASTPLLPLQILSAHTDLCAPGATHITASSTSTISSTKGAPSTNGKTRHPLQISVPSE